MCVCVYVSAPVNAALLWKDIERALRTTFINHHLRRKWREGWRIERVMEVSMGSSVWHGGEEETEM